MTIALWVTLGLCVSTSLLAADARIPMSDGEVRAIGGDPQSGAFFRLPHDSSLDNADQRAAQAAAKYVSAAPDQVNATRYTSIAGSEFRPRSDPSSFFVGSHTALNCRGAVATNSIVEAQVLLPQDARIQFVRIYGTDAGAEEMSVALIERCQPISSAGNVVTTILGNMVSPGASGRFTTSISINGTPSVDNVQCAYAIRAQLGPSSSDCSTDLILDKVRVQWLE